MTQQPNEDPHRDRLKQTQATRQAHAARGSDRLINAAQAKPKAAKSLPPARVAAAIDGEATTRPTPRRQSPQTQSPRQSVADARSMPSAMQSAMQIMFAAVVLLIVLLLIGVALGSSWGRFMSFVSGRMGSVQATPELRATPRVTVAANGVAANITNPVAVASTQKRIGIVSGHRGNDSGSVCADGYTEAELVYQVSVSVALQMRARGYTVDILNEFDPRLDGYLSNVFVSIHADSCTYYNGLLTGFKVARSELSAVPETEDKLVACLRDRYGKATGLRWNSNTITHDMTNYHAFRKIAPQTPAVIIELGFLNLDREALQKRTNKVIEGVMDGILCYVN